ncbi:flavin reductase family protein [Pseudomonas sp. ZM23]|uniref:Flavin reductase family protein n=1 Tax=Pseudomonas triclosanedens TaxID=2961893 RepID=A0ABY6ZWC2_9PSED|nr:flavin reductase family protein [Pseudomonas triclosanedens]MCP8465386.1 flavin reductase family protein [Pseudomonas triclosanedens]MCP8470674.1 flavin reductase family protein [Pseudomonas triclosanedens]MCP8476685.1 flavin reductase family protein [Pseudomonas triclosanedens]WAI48862.1 flavin reductase family protein [Pseudomonas triclosanedens]
MISFDFQRLSAREKYKILIGSVVPRPIALVTTIDSEGRANAAPFSFFNALSADPPILALGVENYSDLSPKDTTLNIRHNQEFTVNIVSDALVEAMNVCAVPFEPGFDELVAAGLTAIPGTRVGCPRIGEAPVALECRRMMALSIGQSREIILGEVLMAHVRDDLIDPATLYIDQLGLDAIGRMGGHGYARTREYFDLPTRSLQQWMQAPGAGERRWVGSEELVP